MSRPESKSSIAFDSDSDSDDAGSPPPVSPIITPTPSIAEKLKKANEELYKTQSPPDSRNSRIGFHEEPRIIEFKEKPESPITNGASVSDTNAKSSSPVKQDNNYYSDEFSEDETDEHEGAAESAEFTEVTNEYGESTDVSTVPTAEPSAVPSPDINKSESEPTRDEEVKPESDEKPDSDTESQSEPEHLLQTEADSKIEPESHTKPESQTESAPPTSEKEVIEPSLQMENTVIEENGKFVFSEQPKKSSRVPKKNTYFDTNYKSPYALTAKQKKNLRQKKKAKEKKNKTEEEIEKANLEEARQENEGAYQAWLERKQSEKKSCRPRKQRTSTSSDKTNSDYGDAWEDWLKGKRRQVKQNRIFEHQNEIERMEGLYVRSRQENNQAFRNWLKGKREQYERERQENWHQVQIARAELRAMRSNQKRAAIVHAAQVAQALDFF